MIEQAETASTGYGEFLLTSGLILVLVCVVAWVVIRVALGWLNRGGRGRRFGPLAIVAHAALDARNAVFVVEVGERMLLLGTGEHGVTLLTELDALSVDRAAPTRIGFAAALAAALRRRSGASEDFSETPESSDG